VILDQLSLVRGSRLQCCSFGQFHALAVAVKLTGGHKNITIFGLQVLSSFIILERQGHCLYCWLQHH